MSKKKLTRQQQWRIDKIQQERIKRANKKQSNQRLTHFFDDKDIDENISLQGIVIKHYSQSLEIEDINTHLLYRCSFKQNLGAIVVGDEVIFNPLKKYSDNSESDIYYGVINAVHERRSLLSRPDLYGKKKYIAANIDTIFIINSPQFSANQSNNDLTASKIKLNLIDRYLVIAETLNIEPIIVINKVDLLSDEQLDDIKLIMLTYEYLNYKVIYSSIKKEFSHEFKLQLVNKNSIFVGQSGVGKSSLINLLIPSAQAKTSDVSAANNKGRHTTSASQLYHLDQIGIENANLIDSPGIREFGLWDIDALDVNNGFKEIKQLSTECRFRDCKHENEPDCAIINALENEEISYERFMSYKNIINSL